MIHDWGSALGFHWANMHRNSVSSITFMEALVTPMTWEQFPEAGRKIFQAMRSPAGMLLFLHLVFNYLVTPWVEVN